MHSYADTFEQPVTVKIGERDVALPILSQRDFLPWIEEETVKQQEAARKNAPPVAVKDNARAKWLTNVDNFEVTPGSLQTQVFRAKGTIRVLETALKKVGIVGEDADKFIDSRSVAENTNLALRVCGLFTKDELIEMFPDPSKKPAAADTKGEKSGPNDEAPASS